MRLFFFQNFTYYSKITPIFLKFHPKRWNFRVIGEILKKKESHLILARQYIQIIFK